MAETFLSSLMIPECSDIHWDRNYKVWAFPCGLRIADELIGSAAAAIVHLPVGFVHQRHHEHAIDNPSDSWMLTTALETGDDYAKMTIDCTCEKR